MVFLGKFFDWRSALVIVNPDTLIQWHRNGFRLFWRWKSKLRGRVKLASEPRELIWAMAADNPTWGEAQIADELLLKLGILAPPLAVATPMGLHIHPKGAQGSSPTVEPSAGTAGRAGRRMMPQSRIVRAATSVRPRRVGRGRFSGGLP